MKIGPQPPRRRLFLVLSIISIVALMSLAVVFVFLSNAKQEPSEKSANTSSNPTESKTDVPTDKHIKIAAMGDMLAHDTIIQNAKTQNGYDFSSYFSDIRPSYAEADAVFCNQEGLSSGAAYGISGYPSFNAPSEFSKGLQSGAGCTLINLANNHIGDKGVAATGATIDEWQKLKPQIISGANKTPQDQQKVSYTELNGIKIALLSFADFNNNKATPSFSVNLYHDQDLVKKLATEARKNADVLLVSMHWGTEDSEDVNADQKAQVELLATLGVDVIIGTGPHVLQEVEEVKRPDGRTMLVWYSLGNMLSSQLEAPQLFSGVAAFDITKPTDASSITVSNPTFTPTYMHYEWTSLQKSQNDYLARKNAHIYLLNEAASALSRSQLHTSIDEQRARIAATLGPLVEIK